VTIKFSSNIHSVFSEKVVRVLGIGIQFAEKMYWAAMNFRNPLSGERSTGSIDLTEASRTTKEEALSCEYIVAGDIIKVLKRIRNKS
jgi:hypothetical protein